MWREGVQNCGRHLWMTTRDANGGWAPLHYTANMGRGLELAKLLLDRGADINMTTADHGHTPLHHTVHRSNTEVAKLLLEKGANANTVNDCGETAGDLAEKYSSSVYYVIKAFLRHDEDGGE